MTMPPSGLNGQMDDQAAIEAEIQLELDNINVDADEDIEVDVEAVEELEDPPYNELNIPDELENYIKRIQDQSSRFELELQECDELLEHSNVKQENASTALLPYDDHTLLVQLASERNLSVEEYKRKVLEDIENDDDIIVDELEGLIDIEDDESPGEVGEGSGSLLQITQHGETGQTEQLVQEGRMVRDIQQAVEEGVVPEDVPVSQDLIPADKKKNGQVALRADIQQMLRGQLEKLEQRYQERIDSMKKDEAYRRDEEELQERRVTEERQYKREEHEREKQRIVMERELAEKKIKQEIEERERQMQEEVRQFQNEMATLQREADREKRQLEMAVAEEEKRQLERRNGAATNMQRLYKGYRVRKEMKPILDEMKAERKQKKMEERIAEVEVEIQKREEEKQHKAEVERQQKEEERLVKEEARKQKDLEKKQKEEEKQRQKEEEERKKQEEKKRKEEEKRQKEEEKRLKKEEEKRRKEEEKKRKDEEEQRKKEEKRLREEEEKRKKEEEKRRKEEEKREKEEEVKRKKEEEQEMKRKKEEEKLQEEKRLQEEEERKKAQENEIKTEENVGSSDKKPDKKPSGVKDEKIVNDSSSKVNISHQESEVETSAVIPNNNAEVNPAMHNGELDTVQQVNVAVESHVKNNKDNRPNTPKGGLIPHPPSPRKKQKDNGSQDTSQKTKSDVLPEKLESLRLQFIKNCLPWSKVSNEPWKLKPVSTKKPLRRPSSAKKLPQISEDVILKAGQVASLKLVTTVQLEDLPGNNLTTLGQCWGLKYLALNNCNLMAVDSLSHCRQLQYLNLEGNKIEYVDLKDLGNLQYLNMSDNRLTSIHGLDSCTNIRWLDISRNNITKLGGLATLRRLHTLLASCNQLISTDGLEEVPTLQRLDVSENHLQALNDLHKLCLLIHLDASANNIQQIPGLTNQVLLQELLLNDNSISLLDSLTTTWLPLLHKLQLGSNSLEKLPSLSNCLLLKELDVSSNQLLETDCLETCVQSCVYLETIHLEDNPVMEDLSDRFYEKLLKRCPRLMVPPPFSVPATAKGNLLKPGTSFEAMCLTQSHTLRDLRVQFENSLRALQNGNQSTDLAQICEAHFRYCEKSFNVTVEFRSAHEYGEITVTIPMAPTTPRSGGRPGSSRHKEKFSNPKDMFENALKASDTAACTEKEGQDYSSKIGMDVNQNGHHKSQANNDNGQGNEIDRVMNANLEEVNRSRMTVKVKQPVPQVNPKDLFEQALKSANRQGDGAPEIVNGHKVSEDANLSKSRHLCISPQIRNQAATTIQAYWRGWGVRREIFEHTRLWMAATTIQAVWRGYSVRKQFKASGLGTVNTSDIYQGVDPSIMEYLHGSATKIQAVWRGYILRKKLFAALEYAQCDFDEEPDEDAMIFDGDFDLNKFVDIDEDLLESDWKPPETPDIPSHHPVLRKPPSGRPHVPPINMGDLHPPNNPRKAWRSQESPASEKGMMPRPPSSVASTNLTGRSQASRKEERLTEEWGFKDANTAHLMVKRARKMKYNAEKRKKLSKLDPKQRLTLYRKLQEVTQPQIQTVPLRKTLPRKEYFQARQDEINRKDEEKTAEFHVRASRTYQWLHTQVGDLPISDSVINKGTTDGPKYMTPSENLPGLQYGRRIQLVSSPGSLDLQSVNSLSSAGQLEKPRRFSAGSAGSTGKLPPIQNTSAPTAHAKERMSFRNAKKSQGFGWGGGRKRGQLY